MKSEDKLRKALDALFLPGSDIKIEELRISDLWKKAGVSKATLYRYGYIVDEFYGRLEGFAQAGVDLKDRGNANGKSRTTVASLKKELNELRLEFDKQIFAARQEIYILHRIIEARDKKIERIECSAQKRWFISSSNEVQER